LVCDHPGEQPDSAGDQGFGERMDDGRDEVIVRAVRHGGQADAGHATSGDGFTLDA